MMYANAALTSLIKETGEITSAEIKLHYSSLSKVSGWLPPKVRRWLSRNTDDMAVIDTVQEQVIDITSTVSVSLPKSDFLEQVYSVRDSVNVRAFLVRYPFLISLLLEARPKISKYFPGKDVSLRVVADPEVTEDEQLMVLVIETSSPDEVYGRLERFDNDWWVGAVDRAEGKLCIDVEFV